MYSRVIQLYMFINFLQFFLMSGFQGGEECKRDLVKLFLKIDIICAFFGFDWLKFKTLPHFFYLEFRNFSVSSLISYLI